jgi:transaldolase
MKLFLDSADPRELRELSSWGVIDGITTTPTFFRRLGVKEARCEIARLAQEVDGEIHVEALGQTAPDIIEAARRNHELAPAKIVSKVPISPAGLEATSRLRAEGVRVNLHLVFTLNQALLGARAGASYLCPLMGRMSDVGQDPQQVIAAIVRTLRLYPALEATVMVSSIRNAEQARQALQAGAGALTVPAAVLRRMVESPLTDRALEIIAEDALSTSTVRDRMRDLDRLPVLAPGARVREALAEMTLKRIGIAAVVAGGRLEGVITDGDLRRALSASRDLEQPLEQVMTRQPRTLDPDETAGQASDLMRQHRIHEAPVLDREGRLLGFLCLHDLVGAGE